MVNEWFQQIVETNTEESLFFWASEQKNRLVLKEKDLNQTMLTLLFKEVQDELVVFVRYKEEDDEEKMLSVVSQLKALTPIVQHVVNEKIKTRFKNLLTFSFSEDTQDEVMEVLQNWFGSNHTQSYDETGMFALAFPLLPEETISHFLDVDTYDKHRFYAYSWRPVGVRNVELKQELDDYLTLLHRYEHPLAHFVAKQLFGTSALSILDEHHMLSIDYQQLQDDLENTVPLQKELGLEVSIRLQFKGMHYKENPENFKRMMATKQGLDEFVEVCYEEQLHQKGELYYMFNPPIEKIYLYTLRGKYEMDEFKGKDLLDKVNRFAKKTMSESKNVREFFIKVSEQLTKK